MEEILASIRRIINDDEPTPGPLQRPAADAPVEVAAAPAREDEVLDLVEPEPRAALPASVDGVLEGLVRELLKPVLRDWLDTHLPDLVRTEVAREIARIAKRD